MLTKPSLREKEWNRLLKAEKAYLKMGAKKKAAVINQMLEEKVPVKLKDTLEAAFAKSFKVIFEKGTCIIEKTYQRDELERQYKINKYSLELKETKKALRVFGKQANSTISKNILTSGVKGVGLGVLGIGIPDIPIFMGIILRGIYEIALQYGYSYESMEERYFILNIIQTSLSCGDQLEAGDRCINTFIESGRLPVSYNQNDQIISAASTLSAEVLCMKFLQGIPVVGLIGGVFDPVFVQRILKYAKLKYYHKFLFHEMHN